jgi:hypothetical protein
MPSPPLERTEQFQPQLEALDVEKQLGKLKRSRASGPDGISPLLLKLAAKSLAKPLSFIFRQSIEHGVLPQDWKDANVLPILKAQKLAAKLDGYRPISLTCMVCRVFEKLLKRSLLHFFLLSDHIDKEQYGFLARRSTTLQMLVCNEEWTKLMDDNERVDIIYLDFKKAFDSVSHKALLYKLSMYGLSGPVLLWIEAFLTDRRQSVFIGDSYSEWYKVESGVPQGSVVGPLLFLLYINDLPKVVKHSSIKLFADDTKIYRKSTSLDDTFVLPR